MGRDSAQGSGVLLPDPSRQGRPGTHRMGQGFPNDAEGPGYPGLLPWLRLGENAQPRRAAQTAAPTSNPHTHKGAPALQGQTQPSHPETKPGPGWRISQPGPPRTELGYLGRC